VSAPGKSLVEAIAQYTGAAIGGLVAAGYREERCTCLNPACAGVRASLAVHVVRGVLEPVPTRAVVEGKPGGDPA
jgi:hypothetical protein